MRKFVENLSERAEFWIVTSLAFGLSISESSYAFLTHREQILSDRWALGLLGFQIAVLALVAWMARLRGWSVIGLGLRPTWLLTGAGVLLYLAGMMTANCVYQAVAVSLGSDLPRSSMSAHGLSFGAVVLVSAINPLFEETLVAGYIVSAMSRHGAAFAVTASALVRLLYHTYQGPVAAACILPLGLVFGAVYWKYRELWPLIVAHGLMDLVALTPLAGTQ